ncbi:MAG: LLM class flavin-dependent oxidoreductase [Actinobacteria bacterium]|nr:LLM class flavin-dependent oxidoreductase [Actinomycetota bacterium]
MPVSDDQLRRAPAIGVPLALLDLATVAADAAPRDALLRSTELARLAETLGYARFWVAEHHTMPGVASSAPEVLLAHVAAATATIRVGSAGVMLPNHPPLLVAERFGTLEALHPGRIDLGIGRAPGTDQRTARALRRAQDVIDGQAFVDEVQELARWFTGDFPADHPYAGLTAVPGGARPPFWLLGSSGFSAQVAAVLGQRFSFAYHFAPDHLLSALSLYRERFTPSEDLDAPYASMGVSVICAETHEEAARLARVPALAMVRMARNERLPMPTLAEADAAAFDDREEAFAAHRLSTYVIGTPDAVVAELAELVRRTGVQELVLTGLFSDPQAQRRSFTLVARASGLSPVPT